MAVCGFFIWKNQCQHKKKKTKKKYQQSCEWKARDNF